MTCSLALRTLRLRAPRYPEADSRILRRLFLPWTDRLTLAIVRTPASWVCEGTGCQRPSSLSTFFFSLPTTSASRPRRRVRLLGFFSSRCERYAFRRTTFPVPVTRKRLAAPRWVFIFGIRLLRCRLAVERRRRSPPPPGPQLGP